MAIKIAGQTVITDDRYLSNLRTQLSDRNRVINGSMQIVNTPTFVYSNNTQGYGGPEMYFSSNTNNAGGQFTQSQGSLTFEGISLPTVRQTVNSPITNTSGSAYWHGVLALLEGYNVYDLRGKPVTISFVFNTNVTGTYSLCLRSASPTIQSYVTTFSAVANTPVQVSIPFPTIPLNSSIPNSNGVGLSIIIAALNNGTLATASTNQWIAGNFHNATGATNWGATTGNFVELTNLQLEEGPVATPFVRRTFSTELALTQRYYETSGQFVNNTSFRYHGTNAISFGAFFAVEKRVTPTITGLYDFNDGGNTSLASALGTASSTKSFSFSLGGTGFVDLNTWQANARF